jgi:hypothetical protein
VTSKPPGKTPRSIRLLARLNAVTHAMSLERTDASREKPQNLLEALKWGQGRPPQALAV